VGEIVTISAYVEAVRALLGTVPARVRDEALAELEQLLRETAAVSGERAAIDAVGPAEEYAAALMDASSPGGGTGPLPQGRVLGMPYDFRGASAERVGERIWNPADPRVFMPRLFGVGWTINFGALAVKLGLIRPDDAGDEAFERIPTGAVRIALAVPAALAAATVAVLALAWSTLPAEVPVHWGTDGAPDDWTARPVAVGMLLAIAVLPVVLTYVRVLRPGTGARTRVLSAASLALISALGLGISIATVADADGGRTGGWIWAVILGGFVLSFLTLYVPVRLGMHAEWREAVTGD
jgi:hypothetical protein